MTKGLACRILALTGTWWLFTGGALWSWMVGLPVILAALLAPHRLPDFPLFSVRFTGAVYFLLYFIRKSFLGGIDVAWRAVHPRCPLEPGLIEYPLRLTNSFATMFFANTISLLPGTLSATLREKVVIVHALDCSQDVRKNLRSLEDTVSKMFGEKIEND